MLSRVHSGLPRPQRLLRQCSRECCRDCLARKVCFVNALAGALGIASPTTFASPMLSRVLSGLPRPQSLRRQCAPEISRGYLARNECCVNACARAFGITPPAKSAPQQLSHMSVSSAGPHKMGQMSACPLAPRRMGHMSACGRVICRLVLLLRTSLG